MNHLDTPLAARIENQSETLNRQSLKQTSASNHVGTPKEDSRQSPQNFLKLPTLQDASIEITMQHCIPRPQESNGTLTSATLYQAIKKRHKSQH
jgi:hypothetical protein